MGLQDRSSISFAFALIVIVGLLRFLSDLYQARSRIGKLRKQGLVCYLDEVSISWKIDY